MSDRRRPRSSSRDRDQPRYRSPPRDDTRKRPRDGEDYRGDRNGRDNNRGGFGDRDNSRDRGGFARGGGGGGGYGGDRDRDRGDNRFRDNGGGGPGGRGGGGGGRDFGGRDGGRFGGRDGGGRFGGRDGGGRGGRGGPGGRGPKKPHMGELEEIQQLVRNSNILNDKACLAIIDPPLNERYREDKLPEADSKKPYAKYWIPPLEPWRVSVEIGEQLDNRTQIVRSNYFRVSSSDIPSTIYHYNVSIYRYDKDHQVGTDDLAMSNEKETNTGILKMIADHAQNTTWKSDTTGRKIAVAYDGKKSLYSSQLLPIDKDRAQVEKDVLQQDVAYPPNSKTSYSVLISLAGHIHPPSKAGDWKTSGKDQQAALQALDIALLSFARWQLDEQKPSWIISGSKAFRSDGTTYEFSAAYLGRLGYMASLKCCISGLLLVSDVSVSCFLKGGRLIDLMAAIAGFRTVEDLYRETSSSHRQGLPSQIINAIDDTLRSCRLKVVHLGHTKKLKGFGPAANHPDSAFTLDTGESITVATYFQQMAQSNPVYQKYLPRGELAYPRLPCIEVGSKKKAIRIPPELLEVIPGQSRSKNLPGDIAGNIIRYAAMLPNDRFNKLSIESKDSGIFEALENDVNAQGFGLNHIQTKPMKVQGVILPPPKLQYGNRVIEPGLKGAWNLAGNVTFAYPAPNDRSSGSKQYSYGLVVAYARSAPGNILQMTEEFQRQFEKASSIVGIPMRMCSEAPYMVEGKRDIVENAFTNIRSKGARIIIVLLKDDVYPVIKLAGDGLGIPTQCVKWKNVEKPPANYHTSVLIKVNGKLGGVNHTLVSRSSNPSADAAMDTFQTPPKSISWLFDAPCMILGVDVNHPEIGGGTSASPFGGGPSVAAVVGSMDGKLGQYCAHISTVNGDPGSNLERAVSALLDTFCQRNEGNMPRTMIIYRDGVADNQIEAVLEKELHAFKAALMARGYGEGYVKIAIVMCQKRHHARFVYETQDHEYANPCVGLCIDASNVYRHGQLDTGEPDCVGNVNSADVNEFYLNSHAAVLGTSKPCKYTLIYDEIGLKLAEIELLTFWMTHLYCRCTRSVSYATPAYYAHWAARRGKVLLSAGASNEELVNISEEWMKADRFPSLYFA